MSYKLQKAFAGCPASYTILTNAIPIMTFRYRLYCAVSNHFYCLSHIFIAYIKYYISYANIWFVFMELLKSTIKNIFLYKFIKTV